MQKSKNSLIIVEDEPIISIMLEEIAIDLGWTVDGLAYSEADAFKLLNACSPKLALLDINLGLQTSLGVAASCRDRHIPVVFITGYSVRDVYRVCGDSPVLAKPFSPVELESAIKSAMDSVHGAIPQAV